MRVLFLTRSLTVPGGWERYTKGLINALAEEGVDPLIAAVDPAPDPDFPFRAVSPALSWAEWGRRQWQALPLNWLKMRIYRGSFDLVHAIVEPLAPSAALIARGAGAPYVVTGHGTFIVEPFATGRAAGLARRVLSRAGAVACVSGFTTQTLAGYCPAATAVTIPNGYTPPRVEPLAETANNDRPYFLTVGPLKERKGQHLLLEAFNRLAAKHPEVDWLVAGYSYKQTYPARFKSRVAELGLTDRVKVLGAVDEDRLQALYRDCLFNALTPISDGHAFEGFGLTYLEAGWWSKPSLAATGCGAGESVGHDEQGLLADPHDPDGLTRQLDRLLSEPETRDRLGAAARLQAERMTWAASARQMMKVYQGLLGL